MNNIPLYESLLDDPDKIWDRATDNMTETVIRRWLDEDYLPHNELDICEIKVQPRIEISLKEQCVVPGFPTRYIPCITNKTGELELTYYDTCGGRIIDKKSTHNLCDYNISKNDIHIKFPDRVDRLLLDIDPSICDIDVCQDVSNIREVSSLFIIEYKNQIDDSQLISNVMPGVEFTTVQTIQKLEALELNDIDIIYSHI